MIKILLCEFDITELINFKNINLIPSPKQPYTLLVRTKSPRKTKAKQRVCLLQRKEAQQTTHDMLHA